MSGVNLSQTSKVMKDMMDSKILGVSQGRRSLYYVGPPDMYHTANKLRLPKVAKSALRSWARETRSCPRGATSLPCSAPPSTPPSSTRRVPRRGPFPLRWQGGRGRPTCSTSRRGGRTLTGQAKKDGPGTSLNGRPFSLAQGFRLRPHRRVRRNAGG